MDVRTLEDPSQRGITRRGPLTHSPSGGFYYGQHPNEEANHYWPGKDLAAWDNVGSNDTWRNKPIESSTTTTIRSYLQEQIAKLREITAVPLFPIPGLTMEEASRRATQFARIPEIIKGASPIPEQVWRQGMVQPFRLRQWIAAEEQLHKQLMAGADVLSSIEAFLRDQAWQSLVAEKVPAEMVIGQNALLLNVFLLNTFFNKRMSEHNFSLPADVLLLACLRPELVKEVANNGEALTITYDPHLNDLPLPMQFPQLSVMQILEQWQALAGIDAKAETDPQTWGEERKSLLQLFLLSTLLRPKVTAQDQVFQFGEFSFSKDDSFEKIITILNAINHLYLERLATSMKEGDIEVGEADPPEYFQDPNAIEVEVLPDD